MAYSVDNIISVTTTISPTGLGYANFAKAFLFCPETEKPAGEAVDTIKVYTSLANLGEDFASTTETYKAAQRWFAGIPAVTELTVWFVSDLDATITDTLNKARNQYWWFWSFFTTAEYSVEATATEIADWCEANESFFINCQTGANAAAIRDLGDSTDIASVFTAAGYRYTATFAHATDAYAGIALAKWFASVNYSGANTTITGEFKKLSGVTAEDLSGTEQTAMLSKKCMWYSVVELQGQEDSGRVLNSITHSTYGEWFDDVVNLAAFQNALKIDLYNSLANQPKKLAQTTAGQAVINATARSTCQRYVTNGFLGERTYTSPETGEENVYVPGYLILTEPEDILSLSDADRAARKSAVVKVRIFRAGAIHNVPVDLEVY